jgi:hypothetical protein
MLSLHWWCCFAKTLVLLAYCALTLPDSEEGQQGIKAWIATTSGMVTCINDKVNPMRRRSTCGLRQINTSADRAGYLQQAQALVK